MKAFLQLMLLGSLTQVSQATEPNPALAPQLVVSGFEPFGGRVENASWVLACVLAADGGSRVRAVQIPVLWGAPMKAIETQTSLPDQWIAFGEGTRTFQIEVTADNQRGNYHDNHRALPSAPLIVPQGSARLDNLIQAQALAEALTQKGFPTQVSRDAGAYLCEEMLYSLLEVQQRHPEKLRSVLFIHVPVIGKIIKGAQGQKTINEQTLRDFGRALLNSLQEADPKGPSPSD